jgi:hypothetical protein
MSVKTRIMTGAGAAVTFAGLAFVPATAAHADGPDAPPAPRVGICRYYLGSKAAAVHTGPGKRYTSHVKIPTSRKKPLFGTCATRGKGRAHWVKIVQGRFKGGWVWRNHLDRI